VGGFEACRSEEAAVIPQSFAVHVQPVTPYGQGRAPRHFVGISKEYLLKVDKRGPTKFRVPSTLLLSLLAFILRSFESLPPPNLSKCSSPTFLALSSLPRKVRQIANLF
jgi:hypothetical protein